MGLDDKIPPQDIEAEMCTLGSMMLDGDEATVIASQITADDFYQRSHRIIFDVIRCIREGHSSPDSVTISHELESRGELEKCGGKDYIWKLASCVPSAANGESYAKIVKEKAQLRKLQMIYTSGLREIENGESAAVSVAQAADRITHITASSGGSNIITMNDAIDHMLALQNDVDVMPFDLDDLDRALNGGLHPGGFALLGGDSGTGKTVLAMNKIRASIRRGEPVYCISRDQLYAHIVKRLWAAESGVPREKILQNPEAMEVLDEMRKWDLYWHKEGYDYPNVCASIKVAVMRYGVKLWVVDYLQRIDAPGVEYNKKPVVAAEAFASVAQDTNTAGLVISRVTKPNMGTPLQHRFSGEAGVQNAADAMLFVRKLDKENVNGGARVVEVIGKRFSGDGSALCMMEGDKDRYREATMNEYIQWSNEMEVE